MQPSEVHRYYNDLELIGSGAYGHVFRATCRMTGKKVVLKIVQMNHFVIREIEIMAACRHENVQPIKRIFSYVDRVEGPDGNIRDISYIALVMDLMVSDLQALTKKQVFFKEEEIKCLMKQLLQGMNYLHENNILHRDIKGENLLLDDKGILKISDHGLARHAYCCDQESTLTGGLVTLNYRPPELLDKNFSSVIKNYGPEVDIWSVGCVFAEFYLTAPGRLFSGLDEAQVLNDIYSFTGMPEENGYNKLSKAAKPAPHKQKEALKGLMGDAGWKLLQSMLKLDPAKRITAKEALNSKYFFCDPWPCHPSRLVISVFKPCVTGRGKITGRAREATESPAVEPPAA